MEKQDQSELMAYTQPISKAEVRHNLEKICAELPIARSLCELLLSTADEKSLRIDWQKNIHANVKNPQIPFSLFFKYMDDWTYLTFYDMPMERRSNIDGPDGFCRQYASIFAGPVDTGMWGGAPGYGNQKRYEIRVHPPKTIALPSPTSKWFFDLMARFALRSSEFHLNVSEQPLFWDGNKECPD